MSEPSIPNSNGQHKPDSVLIPLGTLQRFIRDLEGMDIDPSKATLHIGAKIQPTDTATRRPKGRSRQQFKDVPDSYSPIEHTLYSVQTFGFTHPAQGRFLMAPKEFKAIFLLESKAVAAVVWEVMERTVGWEGDGPGDRREWAPLSVRYFERAKILSRKEAEKGIKRALAMGYIMRRPLGPQRFEYAIRWKGTN